MSIPKSSKFIPKWRKDLNTSGNIDNYQLLDNLVNSSFDNLPNPNGDLNTAINSKGGLGKMLSNLNLPGNISSGALLQGLSTAISGIRSLKKPVIEKPIDADFSKGDAMSQTLGVDNQALINENVLGANAAKQQVNQASRNFGQYSNRVQNIFANLGRMNSLALLQGKQYNDNITSSLIQRADAQSLNKQQQLINTNEHNMQNAAMSGDMFQSFVNQLGTLGSALEQKKALDNQIKSMNLAQQQQFLLNLSNISAKNENFTINQEEMKKFMDDPTSTDFNKIIIFR